jgi:hypothetical protein
VWDLRITWDTLNYDKKFETSNSAVRGPGMRVSLECSGDFKMPLGLGTIDMRVFVPGMLGSPNAIGCRRGL